jgi:hypothetical protein
MKRTTHRGSKLSRELNDAFKLWQERKGEKPVSAWTAKPRKKKQ